MFTLKPTIKTTLVSRNFHETENPSCEISENLHLMKITHYTVYSTCPRSLYLAMYLYCVAFMMSIISYYTISAFDYIFLVYMQNSPSLAFKFSDVMQYIVMLRLKTV